MFNHRKSDKLDLVIGESSKITGHIESAGTILVEGIIIGSLHGNRVILGERSYVKGDISANSISVAGKIEGQLAVRESIEVKATANISGDIVTKRLSVMKGAIFNGRSSMEDAGQGQMEETDRKIVEFTTKEK